MESAAPKHIDKYEVVGVIGRGGMGVVYKAIDRSLNRLVAIKMVTQPEEEGGEAVKRFLREAQFTANLRHANIVTVYQLGDYQGNPYLAMEYLAGQSLDAILARQPLTLLQKLCYVRQICYGLHYAHTRQPSIIHRDIKPANVVVVEDGTVKIVDFGIAKMGNWRNTRAGQLMGSYHYMSPEQISDDRELDGRTDIFSTGVVLYQLLTLTLPFEGSGIAQTLQRILQSPQPPLAQFLREYPSELDDIVARALAKNPNDRYQTASDFAYDLSDLEEKLRKQLFGTSLDSAEAALRSGEFERARQQLTEVLNSDANHTRANDLMRQVQQAEARAVRKKRARELRVQAEHSIEQHSLTAAVNSLEEAVKLDNSDTELKQYREHVVALHQKAEKVKEILASAERACAKNEFENASAAVAQALSLDPESARARSLRSIIETKIAERETVAKVSQMVAKARHHIATLQFGEALQLLHSAQVVNPNFHGLAELLRVAESGYQQELRRVALEKSAKEITDALERGEPSLALNLSVSALENFPDEQSFEGLKIAAEKQIQARSREEVLSGIRALMNAGQLAAAERQLAKVNSESGSCPELVELQNAIRDEQVRIAQRDVENAIGEAKSLMRFEINPQALAPLEAVADRLQDLPAELRAQYEELSENIRRRLNAKKNNRGEAESGEEFPGGSIGTGDLTVWDPGIAAPGTSAPTISGTQPFSLGLGSAARKKEKQEPSIAELTPLEGLPVDGLDVPMSMPPVRSAPNWPAATLKRIEERLALIIGPLAAIVVKKAAAATNDPNEFYQRIAEKISDREDREAFLSRRIPLDSVEQGDIAAQRHTAAEQKDSQLSPREPITQEVIDRGARLLTAHCGPIANILAKRAAQAASGPRAFYETLAEHIENDSDRKRFLRDAESRK